MRVPSVSLVSKENQVLKARRERWELKEKRVWPVSRDATEQMDRRVKLDVSALLAAKETQATEVPMVTLETLVNVVSLELTETREIPDALENPVPLAHLESLDQRERGEVLDHLASLDRKETQEPQDVQEPEESQGEEETTGPRVVKGQMELRETRVNLGQRAREDFQVNQETKEQRETMVCQAPEDHQGYQEKLGKMVPEVTPVMLDQEESLDRLDQRETLEDLASATPDQEDHRVKEVRRAIADLVAAEGTVVKRVILDLKGLQENLVSQGLRVNLDLEDREDSLGVMEILVQREIPASLNVMS